MTDLKEDETAPDFELPDDENETVRLSDFLGHNVVLYFYPKDDTPGCTKESCGFRDEMSRVKEMGAKVIGISADSVESHKKFKEKHDLNFPLLSDEKKTVLENYGVWKEKQMGGRQYMGIVRSTFLIDREGKIAKVYPKVRVEGHVDQVMEDLAGLT